MSPPLRRPEPLYVQLLSHFRERIASGDLNDGDRLPATRELAEQWKVSYSTATKALQQLAADGLITTDNRGSVVTFLRNGVHSPTDHLRSVARGGLIYPHAGMTASIISAELVPAPEHVAAAMGVEVGDQVIRRERVTRHDDTPVTWSVTWMPGELAEQVPALLSLDRIPNGTIGAVRDATGRFPQVGRDRYRQCAAAASFQLAKCLKVADGAPVLLGENTWPDAEGKVLEYGEYAIPQGLWVHTH